jgi:hypothetical protein
LVVFSSVVFSNIFSVVYSTFAVGDSDKKLTKSVE